MAFDIKPPAKRVKPVRRAAAPVSRPAAEQVNKKPVESQSSVRMRPKPSAKIKTPAKKIKKRNSGMKWSAAVSWLALIIVLVGVGFLVWQEEKKNSVLEQESSAKPGIIQTFPGQGPQINSAESNSAEPTAEPERKFSSAEQNFSDELENLKNLDLEPPAYDRAKWEEINTYLNEF